MKSTLTAPLLLACALVTTAPAQNQWIEWPISEGGNGHWYRPVVTETLVSWSEANQAARNAGGYLATITSASENAFVFGLVSSGNFFNGALGPLLGGYQPPGSTEPGGGWTWVTGEPWAYSNWSGGSPDNGDNPSEDGLCFLGGGVWNDKGTNRLDFVSYVVERDNESGTFDLSRDFSTATNPNGVWTYGWKSNLNGAFTAFLDSHESAFVNGVRYRVWSFEGQLPAVACNTSTSTGEGDGTYPPGTVWFVGGSDGSPQNYCVIRFTVPSQQGGTYRLESDVRSQLDGVRSQDSDYHVVVNGVEVFGRFFPPNSAAGYSNVFNLAGGDTIDFLAGRGADGMAYGSGVKIKATLTRQISCIPRKATAIAQMVNGFVVGATITDGGCGYANAPVILIQGGGGSGATARAVVTDGRVTGIIITDAGIGYTGVPRIVIASPPFVPTLTIAVSKVKVIQNVVLARRYVLESSHDARSWVEAMPSFIATSESITNEFDTDLTGRFFRVREIP